MQQTENYKLNLIETTDPFSPAPLNENAERLDATLAGLDAADGALAQRIQVLELKKIVSGTYTGDGQSSRFIDLGFTPAAVLVMNRTLTQRAYGLALADVPAKEGGDDRFLAIVDGGFQVYNEGTYPSNRSGQIYNYIAFG